MSLPDLVDHVQEIIAEAVADADCRPDRVTITAGRPNAPIGEGCTAVYVWAGAIFDLAAGDPNTCVVRSRATINFEINVCYVVAEGDESDEDHGGAADCLHELMGLVWCALVEAKDVGEFGSCDLVNFEPLVTQPRQGGTVSALGGITVDLRC